MNMTLSTASDIKLTNVFVEPNYDFIEVSENPDKTEGFYFNVSRMLKEYERKYKEN